MATAKCTGATEKGKHTNRCASSKDPRLAFLSGSQSKEIDVIPMEFCRSLCAGFYNIDRQFGVVGVPTTSCTTSLQAQAPHHIKGVPVPPTQASRAAST